MVKKYTIKVPKGCEQIEIAFDDLEPPRVSAAPSPPPGESPPRRPPARVSGRPYTGAVPYTGGGMDYPFGWDGDDDPVER